MPAAITITPLDAETRTEAERRYTTTTDVKLHVLTRARTGGLDAVPRRYAPGRARTVTPAREADLLRVIERDPHEVGVDSAHWTTGLLADYLARATALAADAETVRVSSARASTPVRLGRA